MTPGRAAALLNSLQSIDLSCVMLSSDTQLAFDNFYSVAIDLLNTHYPLTSVTVTSRDPPFVTPAIKLLLRQKNKLMQKGQIDQVQ